MICKECGAELLDNAKFCGVCGTKIESNETVKYDVSPVLQKEEKKPKKKRKGLLISIIVIIVVLICGFGYLYYFTDLLKAKIDLNKYINVEFDGYNSVGTAKVVFDYDAFEKDHENHLDVSTERFTSNIICEIDKSQKLSNNDTVTLSWKFDANELKEEYNVVVLASEINYTVDGLKELEKFDPFEGVEVEFSSISPFGLALISKYPSENGLSYALSKFDNLKNGDNVEVTVTYGSYSEDEYAKQYGKLPTCFSKTYEVTGLDEYITDFAEIPTDVQEEIKSEAKDIVLSYVSIHYGDAALSDLEYVGYVVYTNSDSTIISKINDTSYNCWGEENAANTLNIVYKGYLSPSNDYVSPTEVYYPIQVYNVLKTGNEVTYEMADDIKGHSYFYNTTFYSTDGYTNSIDCYDALIKGKPAGMESVCGGGFEEYGKYSIITELDSLDSDFRQSLLDDSNDIVTSYIADFNSGMYRDGSLTQASYLGEYLLTAKSPTNEYSGNNHYVVVYTCTYNCSGKESLTVCLPVRYDGLYSFENGNNLVIGCNGIVGRINKYDMYNSYFVGDSGSGYLGGQKMHEGIISTNRDKYAFEMTDSLKEFGE